jgi:DNA-binding HxlR family transcriptional regulator
MVQTSPEDPALTLEGVLADRDRWSAAACSIGKALEIIGTRSAMLLMREAFYGTTRFDDFVRRVGITDAVASARLKELVAAGLLAREPYREPGHRTRHAYVLTPRGTDLLTTVVALMQWGDRHVAAPTGPPLELRHTGCGAPVRTEIRCAEDHVVEPGAISVRPARR